MSNTSTFQSQPSSSHHLNEQFHQSVGNIFPDPKQNPGLAVLEARSRIADEAEEEHARVRVGEDTGRRFLDVGMIRQILVLRDRKGMKSADIERNLGLANGVVASLSAVGEARVGATTAEDAGLYG